MRLAGAASNGFRLPVMPFCRPPFRKIEVGGDQAAHRRARLPAGCAEGFAIRDKMR